MGTEGVRSKVGPGPRRLALFCFLLAASQLPPARAQEASSRVEVEAQRLEYDAASQTLSAYADDKGKVEVKAEGLLLSCERLVLRTDESRGELRDLSAAGGVQMKVTLKGEGRREVECSAQSLVYSPGTGTVSAAGGVEARLSPADAFGGLESLSSETLDFRREGEVTVATGKATAMVVWPGGQGEQGAVAVVKGHQLRYESEGGRVEASGGESAPWAEIDYGDAAGSRKIESRSRRAFLVQGGEESILLEGEGELTSSAPSGESLRVGADKIEYLRQRGQVAATGGAQGSWTPGTEQSVGPIRLSCGADSMIYGEQNRSLALSGGASVLLEDLSRPGGRQMIRRADEVVVDMVSQQATASGGVEMEFSFPSKDGKEHKFSLKGDNVAFRSKEGQFEGKGRPLAMAGEDFALTCAQAEGSLGADGRGLETVTASGDVSFTGKTEKQHIEAKAEDCVYSAKEQTITARGNVSGGLTALSGEGGTRSWEHAETAVFHLDTGNADVSGERVKLSFPLPEESR